ncbi:MAG: type II secretion system protein N [Steroidobacteraceae bacterium]|nr:type II secretion system protein N [Steroidobacteraceae bacterium]MDW8260730.1 type II secretion system protein N [Gammaproteobacteria bacterium]
MRRWWWLMVVAFVLVLVARLPARWLTVWGPGSLVCEGATGTIWHGQCARLRLSTGVLGPLAWRLRPAALLRGRIAATLDLAADGARCDGHIARTFAGGWEIENANCRFDLQRAARLPLWQGAPPPWPAALGGRLRATVARAQLRFAPFAIRQLQGELHADELSQDATPLGSYRLVFSEASTVHGAVVGELVDQGGPYDLRGRLRLTAAPPGYYVEGTVAARPDAPAAVRERLQFLGPADAAGRRPFALEGTF